MTLVPVSLVSRVAVLANCEPEVRFTDGGLFEAKERMSQTCVVTSRSVGSPPAAAAGFMMCVGCSRVRSLARLALLLDQVGRLSLPVRRRNLRKRLQGVCQVGDIYRTFIFTCMRTCEGVDNHMRAMCGKRPFKISATSEICQICFLAKHLRIAPVERPSHPMVGDHAPRAPCQFNVITNEKLHRGSEAHAGYNRLPGTRINRQQSAASTTAIHARHIRERLLSSFLSSSVSAYPLAGVFGLFAYLTNGSFTLEKFIKVYSLYPTRASIGSSIYWCVASR
jgi:hypothetical protein